MRTPEEIAGEIAKLRKIKPPEAMKKILSRRIELAIAELESPEQANCIHRSDFPILSSVRGWLKGQTNFLPSAGWAQEKPA